MTSTFLLPLAMGACEGSGGNLMTDAFGIVAIVAMTPLIIIQIMGLLYVRRAKKAAAAVQAQAPVEPLSVEEAGEIIEFEEVHSDE
jgi:hypothetical protein